MGKKSKRVRTKQTKEENNKVKTTLIANFKFSLLGGLQYQTSSVRKLIAKGKGKGENLTVRYAITAEGCVRKN
jgi:hypothetical protein